MSDTRPILTTLALLTLGSLACIAGDPGSAGTSDDPEAPLPWDVRGNYALTYDDALTIRLNIGGVERVQTVQGYDEIVDLGTHEGEPLTLNLREYCGREEVTCPSEALWSKVAIDQRDVTTRFDAHVINVIDATREELPPGERAGVIGGLVDHKGGERFLLGIDAGNQGGGECGVLAISLANGRFTREGERWETTLVYRDAEGMTCDPEEATAEEACVASEQRRLVSDPLAPIAGIDEGKVGVGWLAVCAFGPIIAGATLSIETGFTAVRTGELSPPEYVPIEEPVVPDQDVFTDEVDMSDMSD